MGKPNPSYDNTLQNLLEVRVSGFLTPLDRFIQKQTTAAILLAVATAIALIISNSPLDGLIRAMTAIEMGVIFHDWHFDLSIREWISSGLMALFFFLIGLELKREILAGKLRSFKHVSLILMAATGGMVLPAAIYWGFNHGTEGAHGWAIPMATDTAFAVGVLALMARKVSYGVSIFLVAMAIFDDIGAIAVISVFYAGDIDTDMLWLSCIVLAILFFVNAAGIRSGWVYAFLGIILWIFVFHSGLHATLAGLLLAIAVPARTRLGQTGLLVKIKDLLSTFETRQSERHELGLDPRMLGASDQHALTGDIKNAIKDGSTPLQRWESSLTGPIGIAVLPLFALCNAGVSLSGPEISSAFSSTITWGVLAGLVLGKPLGIVLMVMIALRLRLGKLPEGMGLGEVVGTGMLAGIGFTMSLFITTLGFENNPEAIDEAKAGILFGSLFSAALSAIWITVSYNLKRESRKPA